MQKLQKSKYQFKRRDAIALNLLDGFPEEMLWKFVICQAIEDATTPSKKRWRQSCKADALQWLMHGDADFQYVCRMAGYNPECIKRNIAELIGNSFQ